VWLQADVYGFDAASGARLYSWRGLAQQPLVSMAFLAQQQQLVTAAQEPTVAVSCSSAMHASSSLRCNFKHCCIIIELEEITNAAMSACSHSM
jgi:hypothetical protein